MHKIASSNTKKFRIGVVLVAIGLVLSMIQFMYPEYFLGSFGLEYVGLIGSLLFLVLIFAGAAMMYEGPKYEPISKREGPSKPQTPLPPPPPPPTKHCRHCGSPVEYGDKFCGKCGKATA